MRDGGGAKVIDWGAGVGGFVAARAFAVVAGQGLFQTFGIGWGGKGLPSPQKWSENGVDECEQTEEQENRNIVPSGSFLLLSKGTPLPVF